MTVVGSITSEPVSWPLAGVERGILVSGHLRGKVPAVAADEWTNLEGWRILYGAEGPESVLARASIANSLQHLPSLMQGLL